MCVLSGEVVPPRVSPGRLLAFGARFSAPERRERARRRRSWNSIVTETYLRDELAESLARLLDSVAEARALAERFAGDDPRGRVAVRGLIGAARGFLASWLQRVTGKPVLYLVGHGDAFEAARDDLEYFRGRGDTLVFPEPDNLPYDPASPHPAITAERLETLARLARGERGLILATVRGLIQRVPRPGRLHDAVIRLQVGN